MRVIKTSIAKSSEAKRIAFLTFTHLATGKGTEKTLYAYIKFMPITMKGKVTVIQTSYLEERRLTEEEITKMFANAIVQTIPSTLGNNLGKKDKWRLSSILIGKVQRAFALRLWKLTHKDLDELLRIQDVIYLVENDLVALVPKDTKAAVIGSTHMMSPRGAIGRLAFQLTKAHLLYRRIDGFHLLWDFQRWETGRKLDFVLPNGVDTVQYHPSNDPRFGITKFLFVSGLNKAKGLGRLLNAWGILNRTDLELHIVGKGPMEREIPNQANIIYHGALSEERLAMVYRSCDVFVFPTEGESFGLVVLEALASGLFVITSESLKGMFDEFEALNALRYVRNLPEDIARAMEDCTPNIAEIRKFKPEVQKILKEYYDWRSISYKLYNVLDNLIQLKQHEIERKE